MGFAARGAHAAARAGGRAGGHGAAGLVGDGGDERGRVPGGVGARGGDGAVSPRGADARARCGARAPDPRTRKGPGGVDRASARDVE